MRKAPPAPEPNPVQYLGYPLATLFYGSFVLGVVLSFVYIRPIYLRWKYRRYFKKQKYGQVRKGFWWWPFGYEAVSEQKAVRSRNLSNVSSKYIRSDIWQNQDSYLIYPAKRIEDSECITPCRIPGGAPRNIEISSSDDSSHTESERLVQEGGGDRRKSASFINGSKELETYIRAYSSVSERIKARIKALDGKPSFVSHLPIHVDRYGILKKQNEKMDSYYGRWRGKRSNSDLVRVR